MRPAPRLLGALLALAVFALLVTAVRWQFGVSRAGAATGGQLVAQPYSGTPAGTFLGASPQEAPGEVWATATSGRSLAVFTDSGGWQTLPEPVGGDGTPIAGLVLDQGPNPGRTTAAGGVTVAAKDAAEEPLLIVRDPGGSPRAAPDPPPGLLGPEEELFEIEGAPPLLAALEGPEGHVRSLVVPVSATPAAPEAVLSVAGGNWSREPICVGFSPGPGCTAPPSTFRVLALEAAGGDAWMLAKGAASGEGIELFRREVGGGATVWRQVSLGPAGSTGALFAAAEPAGVAVAPRAAGQALTVSEAGVWVDAVLGSGGERHDATIYYEVGAGKVVGSWCDLSSPSELCTHPLGVELPSGQGRSFAWPPDGSSDPFGERVVTGIGQGAILELEGGGFNRITLAGGGAGAALGAALSGPDEGWLGAEKPLRLTLEPLPSRLQPWPIPFRRPLAAIAPEPGAAVAAIGSEALAVGDDGEVGRYVPGIGWEPEFLLNSSGKRATPTLRAVAWPEPGRAFAVGDGAAMWVWQKATGLWSPDPAEPPNLVRANFTGIAFQSGRPSRGYAVGKQGLLLGYGRSWTQERLPPGVPAEANFTSIAFAGGEALATYKFPVQGNPDVVYSGGVLVNGGAGWEVDQAAEAALGEEVPLRVAGLPDGGAAIAAENARGEGKVIERQGGSAPWQAAPGTIGYAAALAAIREGGQVRAIVSVANGQGASDLGTDIEQVLNQPPPGQPPLLTDPYPLPAGGTMLRQTATGWQDEQNQSYPRPQANPGQTAYDLPAAPDPVLALLVSSDGSQGWAVGGVAGSGGYQGEAIQTAGVMRYGAEAAPPANASASAIGMPAGTANFAIGGNAQCEGPCADLSGTGIGPDRWLRAAVGKAAGIGGMRAFLYTGPGVASGPAGSLGASIGGAAFAREEAAYASRLGSSAGALPTFAAAAESDLDGSASLSTFEAAFAGFGEPLGAAPEGEGITPLSSVEPGKAYYSFLSSGSEGTQPVIAIVLDYSRPSLDAGQRCWLAGQLAQAGGAGIPAVVMGQRDLAGQAPNAAEDAAAVLPILIDGRAPPGCAEAAGNSTGASAYFFDYPEQNRQYSLSAGGRSIPAFGTGTLGYVVPQSPQVTDSVGASGFLVASVGAPNANDVAPVSVRLVPNVGSLALDATDGTLLRRSRPALFEALARRPPAGGECAGNNAPQACEVTGPDPYISIPTECQGPRCATGVFPEYTFSSSNPDIADFVSADPASANPRNVLLVNGKPVLDHSSGLLCAFNAGTTTVTVATGGLAYSEKVTVLGGSVQRPCGTTPLLNRAGIEAPVTATPPPATAPPGFAPSLSPVPPPPPTPTPPAPAKPAPHLVHPIPTSATLSFAPLVIPAPSPAPIVPIVPPPPAPGFEPTPPSGTSPVTAPQPDEEEEAAYDLVHHMVAVHRGPTAALASGGEGGLPGAVPALVLLMALAIAAGAGGARRRASRTELAYQSTTDFRRLR